MSVGNKKKDKQFVDVLVRSNPSGELNVLGLRITILNESQMEERMVPFGSKSALESTDW